MNGHCAFERRTPIESERDVQLGRELHTARACEHADREARKRDLLWQLCDKSRLRSARSRAHQRTCTELLRLTSRECAQLRRAAHSDRELCCRRKARGGLLLLPDRELGTRKRCELKLSLCFCHWSTLLLFKNKIKY